MSTTSPSTAPAGAGRAMRTEISSRVRNVLSNWGGYFFSVVIVFFLSPYIVRQLGDTAYGVWALIGSLTGYLGLLDLGVRGAVTRYVAKYHATGDHGEASRIVSSALVVFVGCGLLAVSVAVALSVVALDWFSIPEAHRASAQVVLCVGGLTVAVSLIGGVLSGTLAALQRFGLINLIEVCAATVRAGALILVLRSGFGIVGLAVAQFAVAIATCLVTAVLGVRLYSALRVRPGLATRRHLRAIWSFSGYSFLLNAFSFLILYTDAVVIGLFLPVRFVTFFAIGGSLMVYARQLTGGITQTITPLASRLEAQGNIESLRQLALAGSRYTAAVMLPVAVTFMVRGESFIGLWMGAEYAELSGHVLWVLALGSVFSSGVSASWALTFGIGRHAGLVPIYLIESLSNLLISVILVRTWGVVGVAWGTAIPSIAVCVGFWPWYIRRMLGVPVRAYWIHTWGRPLVAVGPFAVCAYLVERWAPATNLLVFFAQVAMTLPVALAGIWLVCVPSTDRGRYLDKWIGSLGRLKIA